MIKHIKSTKKRYNKKLNEYIINTDIVILATSHKNATLRLQNEMTMLRNPACASWNTDILRYYIGEVSQY
jgi:glutamyl-tRNA reductase